MNVLIKIAISICMLIGFEMQGKHVWQFYNRASFGNSIKIRVEQAPVHVVGGCKKKVLFDGEITPQQTVRVTGDEKLSTPCCIDKVVATGLFQQNLNCVTTRPHGRRSGPVTTCSSGWKTLNTDLTSQIMGAGDQAPPYQCGDQTVFTLDETFYNGVSTGDVGVVFQ